MSLSATVLLSWYGHTITKKDDEFVYTDPDEKKTELTPTMLEGCCRAEITKNAATPVFPSVWKDWIHYTFTIKKWVGGTKQNVFEIVVLCQPTSPCEETTKLAYAELNTILYGPVPMER